MASLHEIRALTAAISFTFAASAIGVDTQTEQDTGDFQRAFTAVQTHSAAMLRGDIDTVVATTHPAIIVQAGGEAKYRELIANTLSYLPTRGWFKEDLGDPSTEYSSGQTRLIGIPAVRRERSGWVAMTYVAASYDAGATWKVFDLACTDDKWLRAIAPGYDGKPNILGPMIDPKLHETRDLTTAQVLKYFDPHGAVATSEAKGN